MNETSEYLRKRDDDEPSIFEKEHENTFHSVSFNSIFLNSFNSLIITQVIANIINKFNDFLFEIFYLAGKRNGLKPLITHNAYTSFNHQTFTRLIYSHHC